VGLELSRAYQILVYGDDKNMFGDNINTIKKNIDPLN
jgi:hypothetical protein